MSIATQTAASLGLTGDDKTIVEILKSTGLTEKPINRAELIHLLNMRGMLRKIVGNNSDEKWTGTVLNMQDAILAAGTDEQKNGIRLWFSHVTNPSNHIWDTTQPVFAGAFWQLFKVFAGVPVMPSSDDFKAIATLGGGWLFADLTAEQYQSEREESEAQAAVALVDQDYATAMNDIITPAIAASNRNRVSIATALRQAAEQLEAG